MIEINDTWSIGVDTYSFVLCKKYKKRPDSKKTATRHFYYPTIEQLANALVNKDILDKDCQSIKELTEEIRKIRELVHQLCGKFNDLRPAGTCQGVKPESRRQSWI